MPVDFFLSLGSNIRAEENLLRAVGLLRAYGDVVAVSNVFQTPALGPAGQPDFLNAVVQLRSELTPQAFQVKAITDVELALGRARSDDRFAPRTIDIDIMLAGNFVGLIDHRRIPSSEILERNFVALPLAEVAPDFIHPVLGETLAAIASRFDRAGMTPRPEVSLM